MYKIYINETPIILLSQEDFNKGIYPRNDLLSAPYTGKKKMLLNYVDNLEKSTRYEALIIYSSDLETLLNDFLSLFTIVKAAGGLVINSKKEVLFIFRRGHWDLPKGKLDPGEKHREAALREVKEECGLKELHLHKKLGITYHVYKENGKTRFLKRTKWYLMSSEDVTLVPQIEEDIVAVKWFSLEHFFRLKEPTYQNIFDVLFTFFKKI